ncbi:putative DNA binding domain-containing protein [Methanospirillum sp. J.3.6.1-F.2.7.3]|uniref:Putative DNA binding domain-containing protein n=1 Tax=Methanospirillum purgamenti TaxID=2834276 RepID=A0A8E7AWQ3_9EURY|nr:MULTISPECIES: RNA-binding domain-containing protein [Methanospirillum]MDX8549684.1 putative DNA binding domain-containing protein [Methanospirillum hungatei]QVV89062.1 putative DNA binding domain-containing protein [Methanospirillum sp. J.3.6.1-F.2.7.3]
MLIKDLLEIISHGENSGVQFKRDGIRPEQLAKEIVALANHRGGMILLGVEDDGTISGIQRDDLETWIFDTVFARYVHPMILPFYETVQIDSDKKVAIISFPEGTSKPYVLRNNDREEIYIRAGSTSRLATREQQARLFAAGGILHTELLPVPGTSFQSLDLTRIREYLTYIIHDPEIPDNDKDWIRRLIALGMLTTVSGDRVVCTIAGVVLFGIQPRKYLRQAGIRLIVYDSEEKTYQTILDTMLDGPCTGRYITNEHGVRTLQDPGLIERFSEMIMPFISVGANTVNNEFRLTKNWQYPFEAIREVVINALCHRDWTRAVDIEVSRYKDRIEIISPGALPNSMTVEKMIAGQRSPRNPLIVEILRDYGYVESRGMGVRTKVIPLMKMNNKTEPVFQATEDYLCKSYTGKRNITN